MTQVTNSNSAATMGSEPQVMRAILKTCVSVPLYRSVPTAFVDDPAKPGSVTS
jgi:hypothetical protein